jgi:hypothetical protein
VKSFLAAIAIAVVVSVGAAFVLSGMQTTVEERFATTGVRLERG